MKKNEIIKDRLEEWVESKGFLNSRFTIIELCKIIGINRTYLSNYIKVGSINSIFYFLHKAAEPFNCLEQDNLA